MRVSFSAVSNSILAIECVDEMSSLIARITHRKGQTVEADQIFNWRNISDTEEMQITADVSGDQTTLEISANYSTMAFFIFFAVMFSGMFLTAAIGGFAFQPSTLEGMALIAIVGAVGSYAAARAAWKSFAQKRHRDLQRLLDALTAFAESAKDYEEVAQ